MKTQDPHLSDRELVMAMDGELAPSDTSRVERHIEACWTCRARKLDLERAVADFVHLHQDGLAPHVPPAEGPRALLTAHLAELAQSQPPWSFPLQRAAWLAAAVACGLAVFWLAASRWIPEHRRPAVAAIVVPNPDLTPGAAVLVSRSEVCRESQPNNKEVPVALQRRVLEEYGLARSEARAYEVDYLITPALGGADDIHNIWPEPYTDAQWNARVKDALEERLHMMVCEGDLDLGTAQREIAGNWIEAYKKYFRTDRPIEYGNP
jgi:hypothetical protein